MATFTSKHFNASDGASVIEYRNTRWNLMLLLPKQVGLTLCRVLSVQRKGKSAEYVKARGSIVLYCV